MYRHAVLDNLPTIPFARWLRDADGVATTCRAERKLDHRVDIKQAPLVHDRVPGGGSQLPRGRRQGRC